MLIIKLHNYKIKKGKKMVLMDIYIVIDFVDIMFAFMLWFPFVLFITGGVMAGFTKGFFQHIGINLIITSGLLFLYLILGSLFLGW